MLCSANRITGFVFVATSPASSVRGRAVEQWDELDEVRTGKGTAALPA
jgi:hypothetical protein